MIDLLIVLAFVVYSVSAGFRARKKASRGLGEYFLAGRTIKGWRAGLSMAATQFAADTPLLVAGLIATGGVFRLWRLWIYGIAFLLMAYVFAIGWRRAGVLTDAEFTEIRYSGRGVLPLRVLKAFYYGTLINCVVLAMVLTAAIRIAEVFLPWHLWIPPDLYLPIIEIVRTSGLSIGSALTGLEPAVATANNVISILLILAFTGLYSMTGGLRSVVDTDVMQFALAMVGTFIYGWIVVEAAGGLGDLTTRVTELYGSVQADRLLSFAPPTDGAAGGTDVGAVMLPFLTIIGLQWLYQMNSDGTGYLAQRSMACRTDADARHAGIVFTWAQILVRSLLWLVIGVGLLVLYPYAPAEAGSATFAAERELLFVTGVDELLPAGVRGIMLTGLLAALASTVDTHLNWGASYWSNDLYDRLLCRRWLRREAGGRELVFAARASNVIILVLALVVMSQLGSIQDAWQISLLFGAGMGAVLVMRWLWERINLYSELAAIMVSLIVAPLLLFYVEAEWIRLGVMAVVSTAAAIGVTFITPNTSRDVLQSFYQRVRPMGFWRQTAEKSDDDAGRPRRQFARRLRLTLLNAGSLFLLLIGLGRLLVPPPGASAGISIALTAAGLALIPFWWRKL